MVERSAPSCEVIYLGGPSSSGKTTLAKAIQDEFDDPFLHIGIDKLIGLMPAKLNNWIGGAAPEGFSWKTSVDQEGHTIREIQTGPFAQRISRSLIDVVVILGRAIYVDEHNKKLKAKSNSLEWVYILIFRHLSTSTHLNFIDFKNYFKIENNEIVVLLSGNPDDVDIIISLAEHLYKEILIMFLRVFKSPIIKKFKKEFQTKSNTPHFIG